SPFDLDFLRSPRVPGGFWRFPEMRFQKCLSVRGPPESSSCSSSCSSFSNGGASSSSFSVMGIYIGVVYTIGRFLRMVFQDSSKRMIYEELPDTARLTDLCNGIYTARITGDLYREHESSTTSSSASTAARSSFWRSLGSGATGVAPPGRSLC
ncbi:unnamed protein product, partial [Prorocentrum cordatum]